MNLGLSISRGEIAADELIEQDINLSFTPASDQMVVLTQSRTPGHGQRADFDTKMPLTI
jgi:hypothetical protein